MTIFLLIIIFVLFVFSIKKVLGIIKNALIIVAASVLFPIFANKFLGFAIPIDGQTIFSFVILGLVVYFIYIVGSSVYKLLSLAEKKTKPRMPKMPGTASKDREEPKHEKKMKSYEKPFIVRQKKKTKNWEKDYASLEDKAKYEYKEPAKKRTKKVKMEKIPIIREDED